MTTAEDIACIELVELVTDYLEGALPPERGQAVEAHLSACAGCATHLEQMRQTLAAVGRIEPEMLSQEQRQTLLELFGSLRPRR